ncbi:hypothetical protein MJH12_18960 [bacterium]|nr:hypothetical protein [bacterium]
MNYTEAMQIVKTNKSIVERYHPNISDAVLNYLDFGGDSIDVSYFHELTGLDLAKIVKG